MAYQQDPERRTRPIDKTDLAWFFVPFLLTVVVIGIAGYAFLGD
jgi:hypothetical protein